MNEREVKTLKKLNELGLREKENTRSKKGHSPSDINPMSSGFIRLVKKQKS